jgi:hypothetical protein
MVGYLIQYILKKFLGKVIYLLRISREKSKKKKTVEKLDYGR